MKQEKHGFFITFEGIDGAGKSTQIKLLENFLQNEGFEVMLLREPGGVAVAEQIRQILLENKTDLNSLSELLLFSASRAELVEAVILPALKQNKVVLLDRFYDSTTAYQGFGRGLSLESIRQINQIASFGVTPHLTFYLDLQPEDGLLRKIPNQSSPNASGDASAPLDRMERAGLDFFRRVRQGYKELVKNEPERFCEIDALASISEIHEQVISKIKNHNIFESKRA